MEENGNHQQTPGMHPEEELVSSLFLPSEWKEDTIEEGLSVGLVGRTYRGTDFNSSLIL